MPDETEPPGRRPSASGRHKTPRQAVQIPSAWAAVARRRAAARKMSVVWYLIDLIRADALAADPAAALPAAPWESGPGRG